MLDATHDEALSLLKASQAVDLVVQHESFFVLDEVGIIVAFKSFLCVV